MLIALFINFLIGYLMVGLILDKGKNIYTQNDFYLHLIISLPFGFGVSALLSFYLLLFMHRASNISFLTGHLILLISLLLIFIKKAKLNHDIKINYFNHINIKFLLIILPILFYIIFCALPDFIIYPFGFWDAISTWNLRPRFILKSNDWLKAFSPMMIRTDYPIQLPLNIIWPWLLEGNDTPICPIIISIFYGLSLILFFLFSISRYYGNKKSFLMTLFLISIPGFFNVLVSQYADMAIACQYLLGTVLCFIGIKEKRKDYIILSQILLSFSLFTKNEGLLFFVFANAITMFYFLIKKRYLLTIFWQSFLASSVSLVTLFIFKGLIPIAHRGILMKGLTFSLLYNRALEFLTFTHKHSFKFTFDNSFLYLFLIIIILFNKKIFEGQRMIIILTNVFVFIGYLVVLWFSDNAVIDHLLYTLPRLAFHLIPSLCFLIADVIFEKPQPQSN